MTKRRDDPDKPYHSHHEQPKNPGSDDNHVREEKKLEEDRRLWKERQNSPRHPHRK